MDEQVAVKLKELRDEFAMSALSGILSASQVNGNVKEIASLCYKLADAMMEERLK